ncbi:MAG TPA: hypothetical protein VJ927_00145 [Actinomycetota bacterium]|nr:hypothetical protein [Actinomycetota bacterium]
MKKLLVLSVAVLLLPVAAATAGKGKQQVVEGTIAAPIRHPDGCYSGVSRHLWSLAGEASNGVVGYTFDVDKATWKKPFTLEATGGVGTVDLDLTYYLGEFATLEEWVASPAPAAPAVVEYETHEGTGEAGTVPEAAVKAIVCVYAAETGQGSVAVPFTYTAGKGVKAPKG